MVVFKREMTPFEAANAVCPRSATLAAQVRNIFKCVIFT
ncbi:hypothetical protein PC128_g24285 [Phytophthora cactorum]|nr:hypothetical protein PC128_g24285 [Phytophthora cactorum]